MKWKRLCSQLLILASLCSEGRGQENLGAVVVSPSGLWEGSDGAWSSFQVELGSQNRQTVRLFPAFLLPRILAVLPSPCSDDFYPFPNVTACFENRGGAFDTNKSLEWDEVGIFRIYSYQNFGYNPAPAYFGFDHVSFGIDVPHQLISATMTKGFWNGRFGLSVMKTGLANDTVKSFLETLREEGHIGSLTWSYTAGACYRNSQGSLILGGYDSLRYFSNSTLSIPMGSDYASDGNLAISINRISSSDTRQLSSTTFIATIQSDFAYMWLPQEVCDAFTSAFDLNWNSTIELYTISDEAHEKNRASNVSVTFELCNSDYAGHANSCAEIRLPYDAFALNATFPIIPGNGSQRYFPIKPANDTTRYSLGRAFLQEAYIFADWDNRLFNISQTRFDVHNSEIVTVSHPLNNSIVQHATKGFNRGSIAGISVGSVAALLLVLGAWIFFSWWRKWWPFKSPAANPPPQQFAKAELDGGGRPWVELSEVERLEMQAHEPPKELPDGSQTAELPGITPIYELPANNSEPR